MRVRPIWVGVGFSQHTEHGRITPVVEHRTPQRRVSVHVHGIHNGVDGQQLDGDVSPPSLRGEVQWGPPNRVTSTYVRPGVDRCPHTSQIT